LDVRTFDAFAEITKLGGLEGTSRAGLAIERRGETNYRIVLPAQGVGEHGLPPSVLRITHGSHEPGQLGRKSLFLGKASLRFLEGLSGCLGFLQLNLDGGEFPIGKRKIRISRDSFLEIRKRFAVVAEPVKRDSKVKVGVAKRRAYLDFLAEVLHRCRITVVIKIDETEAVMDNGKLGVEAGRFLVFGSCVGIVLTLTVSVSEQQVQPGGVGKILVERLEVL